MTGRILSRPEPRRSTPYHQAHSTALAGLASIAGGDDRFYNNIFVGNGGPPAAGGEADANPLRFGGFGLWVYNQREYPLLTGGNVYWKGAAGYYEERGALHSPATDPNPEIVEEGDGVYLRLNVGADLEKAVTRLVNTALLGKAKVSGLAYENADGSALLLSTDYFGKPRKSARPTAGPFEDPGLGNLKLKVW
jgi:hypothetical protein